MEIANSNDFDLITLDVTLPDIDGFSLCTEIKSNPRSFNTPVIFVSGNDCEDRRRRARDVGAVDFVAKPFDAGDFVDRIFAQIKKGKSEFCLQ